MLICAVFRFYSRVLLTAVPSLTIALAACSSSDDPAPMPSAGAAGAPTFGGSAGKSAMAGAPSAGTPGASGAFGMGGSGTSSGGTSSAGSPATGGAPIGSGGTPSAGSPGSGGATAGSPGTAGAPSGGASAGAGTGGSSGSAGSSGAPSTAGSSSGGMGSAGGPSGNAIVSEGFEGTLPAGWDNFIGYVKNGNNPQGEFGVSIDTSKKHGGASSVHFKGSSTPAMLTRPLPANTNKLYVRVWIWVSRQLGNNPDGNHETLIGIRKKSGSADDEVRFGDIKGALGVNEVPSDALSLKPEFWNKGMSIPKDKWVCLEAAFLGDKATHEFYAWVDGTEVHKITGPEQWHAPMPATFLNGKFVEFMIGWHSFSGFAADVWADDLVLSTERVGCN